MKLTRTFAAMLGLYLISSFACHLSLISAPTTGDAVTLRGIYVNGLKIISDTKAASTRTGNLLNLVENGANQQAQAVANMENRILQVRQTLTYLQNNTQKLTADGTQLLNQRDRIQERFISLQAALANTRTLLAGATKAADVLVASADKSGQHIERQLASQTVSELQSLAYQINKYADDIEQTRRHIDLEHTLFKGLQPRVASIRADIDSTTNELTATVNQVAKQRASINKLLAQLTADGSSLSEKYNTFARAIEAFRVTQVAVLRRWLIDGPPAGDLPSLSIDDVIESSFAPPSPVRPTPEHTMFGRSPSDYSTASHSTDATTGYGGIRAQDIDMTQISAETIQNHKRTRWYIAMLQRLTNFAAESQGDASNWLNMTNNWRNDLTNCATTLANQRGILATLQMEQDAIATTVSLIGKQADSTNAEIASAASYIINQADALDRITDELKKRSAD